MKRKESGHSRPKQNGASYVKDNRYERENRCADAKEGVRLEIAVHFLISMRRPEMMFMAVSHDFDNAGAPGGTCVRDRSVWKIYDIDEQSQSSTSYCRLNIIP